MLIQGLKKKKAKAFTFLQGGQVVAYAKVPQAGGLIMDGLQELLKSRGTEAVGPAVWSYRASGPGKLVLRAGLPVKEGTRGKAPFQSRLEPEWECVSTLYQGSMERITDAWSEFFDAVEKKGIHCTDERREIYLKWTEFNSKDNLTELQMRLARK